MLAFKSTRYEALDTVLQCQIVLVGNAPVPSVHDLLYVINAANVKQLFFGSHTSHTLTLHIIYQFIYKYISSLSECPHHGQRWG